MSRITTMQRRLPRLHLTERLSVGTSIELDRTQAHYVLDVMRKKVGDQVRLFNGDDGEWLATIAAAARKRCQLVVAQQLRAQEEAPGPILLFAPIKKARMEMLVEKATELGVGKLIPVRTRRAIVDKVNTARLRAIAIEAAEQCERMTLPEICELQSLETVLQHWPHDHRLHVADETGNGRPLFEALGPQRPAAFLIGPEGGFDLEELERLDTYQQVVKVSLGPNILRAETAGIAVLACLAATVS